MAVTARSVEGVWENALHYHLNLDNDVLCVRLLSNMDTEAYDEDTPEGLTLLRALDDDAVVGMVIISYWKRFGEGDVAGTTLRALEKKVEQFAGHLQQAA
jgi:hypothetical protein